MERKGKMILLKNDKNICFIDEEHWLIFTDTVIENLIHEFSKDASF